MNGECGRGNGCGVLGGRVRLCAGVSEKERDGQGEGPCKRLCSCLREAIRIDAAEPRT